MNIEKVHTSSDTNDADDELRDDHSRAADDKNSASTELFNQVERYGGRTHVNKRSNQDNQERIFDSVKACEENCAEVQNEIDSSSYKTNKLIVGFVISCELYIETQYVLPCCIICMQIPKK